MKLVLFIFIAIALFSEGRAKASTVDPEFMPYVRQFRSDLILFCDKDEFRYKNFQILFTDIKGKNAGTCTRDQDGFIVQIDKEAWSRMDEAMRYQILAHELSHCMLHLDHSTNSSNYMFPVLWTKLTIDETRTQMFSEISQSCSGHSPSKMSLQRIRMFLGF